MNIENANTSRPSLIDTLELLVGLRADTVQWLQVDGMTRADLLAHLVNAAIVMQRTLHPNADTDDEVRLLLAAQEPVIRER